VRHYRVGAHTKHDLKVHLVWIPKYRKPVLQGPVAVRVRDLIRQIAMEHELEIVSGKVARDHVHVLLSYKPYQDVSKIAQWLKGISSRVLLQEFAHLRKQLWDGMCGPGVTSPSLRERSRDEMIKQYIEEQQGEPLQDDSRFPIDSP